MKHSAPHHRGFCMICGKHSKQSICEHCKAKLQGESLQKKLQHEKPGKGR